MGHADHHFFDAIFTGLFDGKVQQRHQAFGPLQREGLLAKELFRDELLEQRGIGQTAENPNLRIAGDPQSVLGGLHLVLKPFADGQAVDMQELRTDRTAVSVLQPLDDLPQRADVGTSTADCRERLVEVFVGEAIKLGIEFGRERPRGAERVNLRGDMPPQTVVPNELVHLLL